MKATVVLSLASLAFGHVLENRACPGNNCNRQVTGTRAGLPALTARSADCSAFLAKTVTPTTTRTRTSTVYTQVPSDGGCVPEVTARAVEARQATSASTSVIPTYAAACKDADAYSAACSCLGVTEGPTRTARGPRVTVTTTLPATSCVANAVAAVPTCALQCFQALYPKYGCTGFDDLKCQCAVFETLGTEVTPCTLEKCSIDDVKKIFPAAQNGCACYSASLGLPKPSATAA